MDNVTDYARPFAGARWIDIVPRSAACPHLDPGVLLHAGPPYPGTPPAPVLQAAIQALVYEGLAVDERAAASLLGEGRVRLAPAQDHGVVTPLAQVVSTSMPLMAVALDGHVRYAPLVEGPAPALRFGSLAPACRIALRETQAWAERVLLPRLHAGALAVDTIIAAACRAGDECHARTGAAAEALIAQLATLAPADAQRLRDQPAFVLPMIMAAAAAALRAHGGPVAGLGGNGLQFGVRWRRGDESAPAAQQSAWTQVTGDAPVGTRMAGHESCGALVAIGDSAVIDFCGLGGQALAAAPLLAADWRAVLPADALQRRDRIVDPDSGIVDPRRIAETGCPPLINLAILDRAGGLIGRGVYAPPAALFAAPAGTIGLS